MLFDTHIHLSRPQYDQEFPYLDRRDGAFCTARGTREELIERMREAGIGFGIDPAIEITSQDGILALCERCPGFLYASVGVHPTRTFRYAVRDWKGKPSERRLSLWEMRKLEKYLDHPAVVAVGETGLDYHQPRREQHRLRQKLWFLWQLRLADQRGLPLILHIREADEDALRILKRHRKKLHGGVCHCFGGSPAAARSYTELGLKLGIGGALLAEDSEKTRQLEQAVRETSLENILLETDGPYVKPFCPELSKKEVKKARNTSLILPAVAERIAFLQGISAEEVERVTTENALRLFGIGEGEKNRAR